MSDDSVADEISDKSYAFDHKNGKFLSEDGEEGRNKNKFINLGDMSAQTIAEKDFEGKDLYGISLEDTFITNSKVKVDDLVEYEALINEGMKV